MSTPRDTGSTVALGALNVLSFTISRPQMGLWMLEAEIDVADQAAPSGAQVLTFARENADPIAYKCTVIESRAHIGRATVFAVAGAGGLRGAIESKDYAEVRPRLVVEDVLRDAVLRDATGAPVLGTDGQPIHEAGGPAALVALDALPHLPRWSRPAGTGRAALTRLVERLSELAGAPYGWRAQKDGTIWIGPETWPAYVSKEPPYYTAEPDARGLGEVALESPDLDPGVTITPPDDQAARGAGPLRISGVVYEMSGEGVFRARVQLATAEGGAGRSREQWVRAVRSALPPLALLTPWRATVVSQDADGALGLRLEEGAPLLTISGVPIWPGLPGYLVQVPLGAQCAVAWFGGREDAPHVCAWAPGTAVTLLRLDQGTARFSRVGDAVDAGQLSGVAPAGGGPVTFTYVPPVGSPPPSGVVVALGGQITSGAPKFKG